MKDLLDFVEQMKKDNKIKWDAMSKKEQYQEALRRLKTYSENPDSYYYTPTDLFLGVKDYKVLMNNLEYKVEEE